MEVPLAAGRVVVLSGLPGDVESDRAYQRSVDAVLGLVTAGGVDSVRVLVNDPERAAGRERWTAADWRAGSREEFLRLGEELGDSEEPVTVVVWGHGGVIRGESVLHVAGPRIGEGDFREFGEAAGKSGAAVRWVLFFPGSGVVAKGLATDGSEVFASEAGTRFASDPIGLDEVIGAWRDEPGATLEGLSMRAGPRIVAWYDSRSMARTEDPAFFASGEGAPVMVAEAEIGAAAEGGAKVGGDWRELARVRAEDYPGADAVVLERTLRYTLGENPAVGAEIEETTQILTAEGKRHGDFAFDFSPPQENLEFVALEVLKPDGSVESFDPDEVLESKEESVEGYGSSGSKVFSLRGVEPGALLHVKYRRTWRRFPFPHVFLELPVAGELPVRRLRIAVEVGADEAFHAHIVDGADGAAVEPTARVTSYGTVREWAWDDVAAAGAEVLAPPGGRAALQISTFPDWSEFVAWYLRLTEEADVVTDEIRAMAAELTAGSESAEGKVRAIYEFVTGLRYVSIPLGVNSYRPHAAGNVLANRYGDCKDKANLLNALCRAEGIDAKLVLVPRFSEANEAVPGLAFNHAISRVELPDGGGVLWLDSTDDVCPFGLLPPGDPGRDVLVVDAESTGLVRLPEPEVGGQRLEIDWDFSAEAGRAELRAAGFAGYAMRSAARASAAYGGTLPLLRAAGLEPVAGVVRTTDGEGSAPGEIERDFVWSAAVELIGAGEGGLPFVLPREWELALQPRSRAVLLNDGYPLTLAQTVRGLAAADGIGAREGARSAVGGPVEWELTWKDGVGRLEVRLVEAEMEGDRLEEFRATLRGLYRVLGGAGE